MKEEMRKDMKKFIFLFAATFLVMWGVGAQAAFKWSADAGQSFTFRNYFDLHDDGNNAVATRGDTRSILGTGSADGEHFFSTLFGINGAWDLVKDTSFNFRIASQFDWLGTNTSGPSQVETVGNQGPGGNSFGGASPFSLMVNQMNLNFNDFAGFPVNFKFGRQNIWLGKGFVLGNRLFGAGPTLYAGGQAPTGSVITSPTGQGNNGENGQVDNANTGNLPLNSISGGSLDAPETSDFSGFDAVVANLHLLNNKLNFDFGYVLVASALTESAGAGAAAGIAGSDPVSRGIGSNDDETLWFFNTGYKEKAWNVEAYLLFNHDKEPITDDNDASSTNQTTSDKIYTYGARGDFDWGKDMGWLKNVNTFAEFAYQGGELGSQDMIAMPGRKRMAYAWNFGSDFSFSTSYSPSFGLEAVYFSGVIPDDVQGVDRGANGAPGVIVGKDKKWTAWDPQFRGKFFTKIMDFLDSVYITDTANFNNVNTPTELKGRVDAGFTNRMLFLARTGFEPMKKTSFGLSYAYAMAAQLPQAGAQKNLGQELDWDLGYQLSNVASWYFDGGIFFPGSYYSLVSGGAGATLTHQDRKSPVLFRTGFKLNLG